MSVQLINESEIKEALKEFRSDSSPINWVLFSYEGGNSNNIILLGKGEGGVSELISQFDSKIVGYALARIVEKIDNSDTVKFAYINWVGEEIPRMLRARLATHSGKVKELVTPYHVSINPTNLSEISEEIVVDTVSRSSGTKSNVLAGSNTSSPTITSSTTSTTSPTSARSGSFRAGSGTGGYKSPSSVPTSSGNVLNIDDENEVKGAIKDVRSDASDTNWCLIGYKNDNTLTLLGSGSGGVSELVSKLDNKIVGYGLVREVERFDLSDTVKFAYINWVGEEIPRMLRARLATHSGKVKELITPYHVSINPTQLSEITPEIVTNLISTNSGTRSNVLSR